MKRFFILILVLFLSACKATDRDGPTALTVGGIKVSAREYKEAFVNSPYGAQNTPESRKQFLESYALKLMILQEAEDNGLDRDVEFLKEVEFFWQQALIKRMLERKMDQYAKLVNITDQDVQTYYVQNQSSYFKGKSFQDVAPSIKSFLTFQEQNQGIEDWMQSLKGKIKLRANKALIGLE